MADCPPCVKCVIMRIMKKVLICAMSVSAALARADGIARRMPSLRRERYEATRDADLRGQLLAASGALEGALAAFFPDFAPPADFFYFPDGRPGVKGACVSIAHTRGMAVCAVSDSPVGADIERTDREIRPAMARKILAPGENPETGRTLLNAWVDKEAYLKLTGQGLAGGMHRFMTADDAVVDMDGRRLAYIIRPILDGYRLAVCCRERFTVQMVVKA